MLDPWRNSENACRTGYGPWLAPTVWPKHSLPFRDGAMHYGFINRVSPADRLNNGSDREPTHPGHREPGREGDARHGGWLCSPCRSGSGWLGYAGAIAETSCPGAGIATGMAIQVATAMSTTAEIVHVVSKQPASEIRTGGASATPRYPSRRS